MRENKGKGRYKDKGGKFQKKGQRKTKRGGPRDKFFRKKFCKFCVDKIDKVDYKNVSKLKRFITEKGKILPSRITGNCAGHQRRVVSAVKRARFIALLPFVAE